MRNNYTEASDSDSHKLQISRRKGNYILLCSLFNFELTNDNKIRMEGALDQQFQKLR
jgi:hypothetical protein